MFTIIPFGATSVREQLGGRAVECADCLKALADDAALPPVDVRPFVQLSHFEITEAEIELALGEELCASTCPIGVPDLNEGRQVGPDVLLFSLGDLNRRLGRAAPKLALEFDRDGADAIMEAREVTAFEYLVLGSLHCIAWCDARRAALQIRW